MAKLPVQLLLISVLLPAASGLMFDVDVDAVTDHSFKDLEYSDEVEKVQEINATVENTGSIGCTYRMKADFRQGNESFERFSSPEPLWQGEYDRLEISYIPKNYTGVISTNLSLEYCGQDRQVDSFSFNVTENTIINDTIESRTISSTDESAEIEIKNGSTLVPEEEPAYWKTGSADIVNSTAEIEYDAPIFDQQEEIKYTVLEEDEILGTTTVSLEPEPTLKEKIMDRKLQVVAGLFGLSALINLLLVLRYLGVFRRIREFEYELPHFRQDPD